MLFIKSYKSPARCFKIFPSGWPSLSSTCISGPELLSVFVFLTVSLPAPGKIRPAIAVLGNLPFHFKIKIFVTGAQLPGRHLSLHLVSMRKSAICYFPPCFCNGFTVSVPASGSGYHQITGVTKANAAASVSVVVFAAAVVVVSCWLSLVAVDFWKNCMAASNDMHAASNGIFIVFCHLIYSLSLASSGLRPPSAKGKQKWI